MVIKSKIADFKQSHLEGVDLADIMESPIEVMGQVSGVTIDLARRGRAASITAKEDMLIGVAGCLEIWPGVGEFWLDVPRNALSAETDTSAGAGKNRHINDLFYWSSHCLDVWQKSMNLHRIQGVMAIDNHTGHMLLMSLDFAPEAQVMAYGPNKEHYTRYARLKL